MAVLVLHIRIVLIVERCRTAVPHYYNNADGFIVMYDIGDEKSFQNVAFWMSEIGEIWCVAMVTLVGKKSSRSNSVILVGNKCDNNYRQVQTKQGKVKT